MQADIADLVHPIFRRAIALRAGLEASEALDWGQERAALKELLAAIHAADTVEVAGPAEMVFDFTKSNAPDERGWLSRTTIHYALTAWLDEFLSHHSAWGPRWRDAPLEAELYGSRARGGKFWDEARYVETRGDGDALEVMYLCVMLGFRGDWRAQPKQIASWTERVRTLLTQAAPTWTMPAALAPPREMSMPGDRRHRRMAFSVLLAAALVAPLLLMALWRW